MIRSKQQISLLSLPVHGDEITDRDGSKWTVKMEGGFKLRNEGGCHLDFINGPLDAIGFTDWFNSAYQ